MSSDRKIFPSLDLASDFFSEFYDLYYYSGYSIELKFDGNPQGMCVIQSANYPEELNDWHTIPDTFINVNRQMSILLNFKEINYRYCRIKWVKLSGNGTLKAVLIAKGRT